MPILRLSPVCQSALSIIKTNVFLPQALMMERSLFGIYTKEVPFIESRPQIGKSIVWFGIQEQSSSLSSEMKTKIVEFLPVSSLS